MRRSHILALSATCLAAAGVVYLGITLAQERAQDRSRGTWIDATRPWGEVTGAVRDSSGRAVQGAVVLLQNLGGFGGRGETDDHGRYRIPLMLCSRLVPRWPGRSWPDATAPESPTTIYCVASADGYCGSSVAQVEAHRGVGVQAPGIILWRGGYVSGRTIDQNGIEVAARVRVVGHVPPQAPGQLEAVPPSHPAGFVPSEVGEGYRLGPIAPGTVEIWATAPGTGASSTLVQVTEGQTTNADLKVDLVVHISGKVVDSAGAGVAGVQVVCRRQPSATADAQDAPSDPPAPGAVAPVTGGGGDDAARQWMVKGKHSRGQFTASAEERAARRGVLATQTDDAGHFYFYGLREDADHEVSIVGCNADPAAAYRGLRPSRGDIVLRMPRRFTVRGLVRDVGSREAVKACVLQVLPESSARYLKRRLQLGLRLEGDSLVRSGPAGDFETTPLFPGVYRLSFMTPGYEVAEQTVTVDAEAGCPGVMQVDLERASAITGTVEADEGTIANATVEAWCQAPAAGRPERVEWIGRLSARADGAGAFRIEGLPANELIHVRARGPSGRTGQVTIQLQPGEERRVAIRIEPASTLTVSILPRSRGTREGHPIRLVGIDDPDIDVALASDADGLGRIKNLPPGRYKLLAVDALEDQTRPDVQARVREITVSPGSSGALEIEVPDVTMMKGTVSIDGIPAQVAKIGFGPVEGTPDHFRPLLFDVANGTFQGRVPPGTYHVHVRVPGKRFEYPDPVAVPNAPTQGMDIALASEAAATRR